MSVLSSFWEDFLVSLSKNSTNTPILLSVLKQVKPIEIGEEKVVIGCDNQGVRFFLEKRQPEIERALYNHLKKKARVYFQTIETKKKKPVPLLTFQPSVDDIFHKSGLHGNYAFENFCVSSTNQVAYAASQAVAKNLGTSYNPLFLYGGVGVGKTHLAQAVARKALKTDGEKKVFFCPGDHFINDLVESIRDRATARFRRKYRALNLLILDDIQFIAGKERVQEEFFHTFNSVVSSGGQIILTSDRPPTEIKNLEDRLRSRFSGGLIVDIQSPDFELRCAILLIKAKEKNIEIDIEAAKIIADTVVDSRALEGTLLSLYAKILGTKEKIDLETVEAFFSEKQERKIKKITSHDIIRAVCSFYNLRPSHLKGDGRSDAVVLPRQIAMYLLRRELGLTQTECAFLLKRKDHTTVIHAERKVEGLAIKDTTFKAELDKIINSLSQLT